AELCNECGNCVTFCPERGAPYLVKPRLYTDASAWEAQGRNGLLVAGLGAAGQDRDQALVAALTGRLDWLRDDDEA
ncbi:MAG: hypothetical protein IPI48_07925, partial [bacterium]|nr:hypothetical protein [bacterium]